MTTPGTKWRKKPVEIDATEPLTKDNAAEIAAWVGSDAEVREGGLLIATLEGAHHASWGDRIVRGVRGEHYPVKPDIFDATYEPADWRSQPVAAPSEAREDAIRLILQSHKPSDNYAGCRCGSAFINSHMEHLVAVVPKEVMATLDAGATPREGTE